MKKLVACIAAVIFTMILLCVPSFASEDLIVEIVSDKSHVEKGEEFVLTVRLPNIAASAQVVYSLVGTIEFDQTKFEYVTDSSRYSDAKQEELALVRARNYLTVNVGQGILLPNQIRFLFLDEIFMAGGYGDNPLFHTGGRIMEIVLRAKSDTENGAGAITYTNNNEQWNVKCDALFGLPVVGVVSAPITVTVRDITLAGETGLHSFELNSQKYISGIEPGKTVADIQALITEPNMMSIKVFDAELREKDSGCVGTGMKLRIYYDGVMKDEATVVIYGDVDGDGLISVFDIIRMKEQVLGIGNQNPAFVQAVCLVSHESPGVGDIVKMKRYIVGLDSIPQIKS